MIWRNKASAGTELHLAEQAPGRMPGARSDLLDLTDLELISRTRSRVVDVQRMPSLVWNKDDEAVSGERKSELSRTTTCFWTSSWPLQSVDCHGKLIEARSGK